MNCSGVDVREKGDRLLGSVGEIGTNLFSSSEDPTRYIPRYKPLDITSRIMTI